MLLVALPFITKCNVCNVRVGTLKAKHVSLPNESRHITQLAAVPTLPLRFCDFTYSIPHSISINP